MRGRIRAGAFGIGCAGLLVLTLVTPAAGLRQDGPPGPCDNPCSGQGPDRPGGGDVIADCEDASMNTMPSGGDVHLAADLPDGARVAPGQDIRLRLTWDRTKFSGDQLDRVLDCVRLKGGLDPDMSNEQQPADNSGTFDYRLHVPEDIRPGCDICAEGFVAGAAAGGSGPLQLRSERHCFMSGPPVPPGPPATSPPPPPGPPVTQPPPPETAAAPPRPPAEVPPPSIPTEVGGITASQPGSNPTGSPAPEVAPAAELPRTGAPSRTGTAAGGLGLALGGFAVMGGAGRKRRRSTV
ncbi:MAG TPA: hypothetical protein VHL53_10405 [Acidimicrobiia bacterium]|nr:hypothetical protein [Acidimicrobiia bacterium]